MNLFFIFKRIKKLKKDKKGFIFTRDPRGCDVACKATWQSHADPRERLHGADVTHVHIYILYIIHRVIVHISIPYSELATPLFSSHLRNPSLSLNFYRVGLCCTFVFNCR